MSARIFTLYYKWRVQNAGKVVIIYNQPSGTVLLYFRNSAGKRLESDLRLMFTATARPGKMILARILSAKFQSSMRNAIALHLRECCPGETSNYDGWVEYQVNDDDTWLVYVMRKRSWRPYKHGKRFEAFYSFNHLCIGGTLFEHKVCHKVNWVSTDKPCTFYPINHIVIKSSLLNMRNKRGADSDLKNLKVPVLRPRFFARVKNLDLLNSSPFAFDTRLSLNGVKTILPTGLQVSRAACGEYPLVLDHFQVFFSQAVGQVPKARHRICMSAGTGK